jgi:hypothetical protein
MDWIEQLLGVSPDGGSGALEAVYLAVFAFAVALIVRWRLLRGRKRSDGSKRSGGS